MHRCIELARLGSGSVAPNPMVGSVLVYNDAIIGEGYHQQYGQAHAEVNCINSVSEQHLHLVAQSTLYVSLEPCAHYGKTPPCADLIIQKKIPVVVIGCRDSFEQVDGKGIEKLKNAGVQVITPVLGAEALDLNKAFFCFHKKKRPYIILKWAQTANGQFGNIDHSRLLISSSITNRKVHQLRSNTAAIMVGTNTALVDDPALTSRLWPGKNPTRLVIDKTLKLPLTLQLFDRKVETIVFNNIQESGEENLSYIKISDSENMLPEIMARLYKLNIQSVMVEGGARLLQSFIDQDCWDEAMVITNTTMDLTAGIQGPLLSNGHKTSSQEIHTDLIQYYKHL